MIKLPSPMFASELRLLRKTKDENGVNIVHNNRPLQPLNGRIIYSYWMCHITQLHRDAFYEFIASVKLIFTKSKQESLKKSA